MESSDKSVDSVHEHQEPTLNYVIVNYAKLRNDDEARFISTRLRGLI